MLLHGARHRAACLATALAAAALALLAALPAGAQDLRFFRIGTGTTGGTYFPVGGIIASAISNPPGTPPCELGGSCGVPGLIAVAQASRGSVENIANMRRGLIESSLCQADVAFQAFTATGPFEGEPKMLDLRAIAHLYTEPVHVVVSAGVEAEGVADLAGLRINLGEVGSGILVVARLILEAYGLDEADLHAEYRQPEPAADRIARGQLDGMIVVGGAPFLAVADLARRHPVRLLGVDNDTALALVESQPFLSPAVIEAGVYRDVGRVETVGVGALLTVLASVEAETVHGITRALWHPTTRTLLANAHPRGKEIRLARALQGVPVLLHPGALRYYSEEGLLGPAHDLAARGRRGRPEDESDGGG